MAKSKHTTLSRRAALAGGASVTALAGIPAALAFAKAHGTRNPDTPVAAAYAKWDAARSVLQRHEEGEPGLDVATAAETYKTASYELSQLAPETVMDIHRMLAAALNLNVWQYMDPDDPQAQGPHFDIIAHAATATERAGHLRLSGAA